MLQFIVLISSLTTHIPTGHARFYRVAFFMNRMTALKTIIISLNCVVLINSAALSQGGLRRLLQVPTACPKIAQREAKQVVSGSLCRSEITQNIDKSRIPQRIEEIKCIETETCNYCYEKSQCVQVQATIEVYYWSSEKDNKVNAKPDSLTYNSGCVCASVSANEADEKNVSKNLVD